MPRSTRTMALGLVSSALASQLPCDIYASSGSECVAAHSTVRSLFGSFTGALYQVTRTTDGSTTDIQVGSNGVADAASQDSFCSNSTCLISIIYDQSGNENHLSRGPKGYWSGPQSNGDDDLAGALGAPVTIYNGQKAYGVFVAPGTGYRIDNGNKTPTGNDAQSLYAVIDGTHYNDGCCFDYGNAETDNHDDGDATMQAIYYGTNTDWGRGSGSGPWIMADLENGLWGGNSSTEASDPSLSNRFQTAFVKGSTENQWDIRGADSTSSDGVSTYFSGTRPNGYYPMQQQGSIVLGIGGDNSNGAQGTFYEGAMVAGYVSDDVENQVQTNIASAGYEVGSLVSGPAVSPGSTVSFRATTPGFTDRYLWHNGSDTKIVTYVVDESSADNLREYASWHVVDSLANIPGCVSFESVDTSGSYIRHYGFELYNDNNDGSTVFGEDATWCPQEALNSVGTNAIRSWEYPTRYFRHYADVGYAASDGGPEAFDATGSYTNDVSWVVGPALAS